MHLSVINFFYIRYNAETNILMYKIFGYMHEYFLKIKFWNKMIIQEAGRSLNLLILSCQILLYDI